MKNPLSSSETQEQIDENTKASESAVTPDWDSVAKTAIDVENEWQTVQDHIDDRNGSDALYFICRLQQTLKELRVKIAENGINVVCLSKTTGMCRNKNCTHYAPHERVETCFDNMCFCVGTKTTCASL